MKKFLPDRHISFNQIFRYRKNFFGQGSVFLEFALTLVVLVPTILATIEISHAISQYKIIVTQTRAAARYLMTQPPGDLTQRNYAKCLLITATLDCSGKDLLPGLDSSNVSILDSTDSGATNLRAIRTSNSSADKASIINLIEVKVTGYRHNLGLGWTNITFSPISIVVRQTG